MNRKIIATLIVLLFCVSCFSFVSADNITNETIENNESEVLDMSNYIRPVSISGNEIEFSDGFTGFCLDLTKDAITADDGFVSEPAGGSEIQNYVKLAIIEAYRQDCEDNLGQIISIFADGSYASSNDKVITEVLKSQETVGDTAVVELEDSIEGTFEFELLKDVNGVKSDCLAYRVSLKEVPAEDVLGAAANNNTTEETNDTSDAVSNSTDNATEESAANQTENTNATPETIVNQTENNNVTSEIIVNQTNETVVNETNNVIINNTTINQNNTKITNVTKETPQNATVVNQLMKTAGNPIFILIVVIAILAVAGIYMRKKG
ncbi:hypothetical protein [Methanobrevibacter sp.]